MSTTDPISILDRRIERLQEQRDRLAFYGEDIYDSDDVVMFKRSFNNGGTIYTYVALKAGRRWFITGRDGGSTFTWHELILHMSNSGTIHEVWVVTAWEEVS